MGQILLSSLPTTRDKWLTILFMYNYTDNTCIIIMIHEQSCVCVGTLQRRKEAEKEDIIDCLHHKITFFYTTVSNSINKSLHSTYALYIRIYSCIYTVHVHVHVYTWTCSPLAQLVVHYQQ